MVLMKKNGFRLCADFFIHIKFILLLLNHITFID